MQNLTTETTTVCFLYISFLQTYVLFIQLYITVSINYICLLQNVLPETLILSLLTLRLPSPGGKC